MSNSQITTVVRKSITGYARWHRDSSYQCKRDFYSYGLGYVPLTSEWDRSYRGPRIPGAQWPYRAESFVRSGPEYWTLATGSTVHANIFGVEYQLHYAKSAFNGVIKNIHDVMNEAEKEGNGDRVWQIAKMYEEVNAPQLALATSLAELKETIAWSLGLFNRFRQLLFAFMWDPGYFAKTYAKEIGAPSNSWLEFRYAVMPLILELSAIRDYFQGKLDFVPYDVVAAGKRTDLRKNVALWKHNTYPSNWSQVTDVDIRSYAGIRLEAKNDLSPLGTGAFDLVAAAWEVVTLSFVVDWFLDIGMWIGSMRSAGAVTSAPYATYRANGVFETVVFPKGWTQICGPVPKDPIRYTFMMKDRIVGEDVIPSWKPLWNPYTLSIVRQFDALALILGAISALHSKTKKKITKR